MSTAIPPTLMTAEELDAMPEDGIDRELIRGELRIRGVAGEDRMTRRNRFHAATEATLAKLLGNWLDQQPQPRGRVFSAEVGCILSRDPDTSVGIDVAYFSAASLEQQSDNTSMIEGPPVLAIEILSPSDKLEDVNEKVDEYLAAGVALVWVVDPHFHTVTVFQPDVEPQLFNKDQFLTAAPHLPSLSIAVRTIFAG